LKIVSTKESQLFQSFRTQSIEFSVPFSGRTILSIVNPAGQNVVMLFDGTAFSGKNNRVQFNTNKLSRGAYYSKLECNGVVDLKKIVLVR
jgi:hypothetical protein